MADERISEDRAEGTGKQWSGSFKEKAGGFIGDEKMKREGQAEQSEGKLQNAWGSAKDSVREALGTKKD
ncbi:MAG: CsbD family protein [Allosphingosinicella sp.]|uniref:CsbD family protein n=1 Tax=Allosphingosinicella sp. TaxID=2823234 RepID=UPI0039582078